MKIAIVGMGVAGMSVLREWTKEQKMDSSIKLTVFGDKHTFGTGVPYQKDDESLLMNQAAEITTIIPENKNDFVEWLQKNQGEENPNLKYYPRELFGVYLTERMNDWLKKSNAEIKKEKVKMIQMLPDSRFRLTSSSGTEDFDVVHLCIGNLPYKDPYHLIGNPNVIANPFPIEKKLSMIPYGATVGVLGTGLTSIDIFRYTFYNRSDLNVSFFSHSGRFKSIIGKSMPFDNRLFTKENIKHTKAENSGFIPLDTYIEWFKKELDNQDSPLKNNEINSQLGSKGSIESELNDSSKLGIIQTLLNNMDPFLTDIWMALNEVDKQTFLNTYYTKWDKLRSPFPPATGKKLVSAWEENKINVFDNLSDITQSQQSFKFTLKNKTSHHTDYLINAAGNEMNVSFEMDRMPLLQQLLSERLLQPETFGGVQVSLPDLSAVSQKYGVLHTLKIHGQLITGIQFGNNSVNIISDSARSAVQDIMQQIKSK